MSKKINLISNISQVQIDKLENDIKSQGISYEYDTKDYPIDVIYYKFNQENIIDQASIFIPDYQRNFVWTEFEKSRFIESLFLGVPIQPIFTSINEETGNLEIIDGSQRIRTIISFIHNEFTIRNVEKLLSLNGFKFKDLPPSRQRKFQTRELRFQVINENATEEIKRDIFYRLNTSGNKASDSEIRKGSYAGKFMDFIIEMSDNKLFNKLVPIPDEKLKRLENQELITRFFAYSEQGENEKLRGKVFFDSYVKLKNEQGFDKETMIHNFETMLKFVDKFFPNGFKKSPNAKSTQRVRFEAISVGVHLALQYSSNLVPISMEWLNSKEFEKEITSDGSTNTGRLTSRVNFVRDCLISKMKF